MLNKKDEKIFVDLDDEITFVVERILDSDADRIVLVAPEGAAIISSLVSIKLLSKLVFKHGKSIVLVTLDDGAHKFAKKAGVPVIKKIADLSEGVWLESEDKLRKRGLSPVLRKKEIQKDKVQEEVETVDEQEDGNLKDLNDDKLSISLENNVSDTEEELELNAWELENDAESPSFLKSNYNNEKEKNFEESLAEFGFVVGEDIAKVDRGIISKKPEKILEKREYVSDFHSPEIKEKEEDSLHAIGRDMTSYELKTPVREKIEPKKLIKSFRPHFPKLKLKTKLLIPLVLLLILLSTVGGIYAYFIAPEATLTARVKYETVDLEQEIGAETSVSDVDLQNLKIPLIMQEVEESGSDSKSATGTEVRGDKAKGKVTLLNKETYNIQLNSGTALSTTVNGSALTFIVLENNVIPSAQEGDFGIDFGQLEISVEAYDLGTEYNIDSGNTFSVEGFTTSEVVGRNLDAIAGGTREEVTVVTADDRNSLKDSLLSSLEDRVKTKVKNQIGSGFEINDEMINVEVTNETYDVDAGGEASSVNLNVTVKATAYVYSQDDIEALGEQLLMEQVSSDLKLIEDQSEYVGSFVRRDGDSAIINLSAVGIISGNVTEDSIKDLIAGRSEKEIEDSLDSLSSITGYELVLGPEWLPDTFKHIPSIKGKIVVALEVDKQSDSEENTEGE